MKLIKIGELPEFALRDEKNFKSWKGSQGPTPSYNGKELKVSFSARDVHNRSFCFSYYLDPDNPLKVESDPLEPDFSPCEHLGRYYSDGFMISQYYTDKSNSEYVYFTGWEDFAYDNKVRYRTACGQVSKDGPAVVPFIERTKQGPCGSSMPFRDGNVIYYMAINDWNLSESFYNIASWEKTSQGYTLHNLVLERQETEGGLARPVVFNIDKTKYMMFSARGKFKFRENKEEAYKLHLATYEKEWSDEWSREPLTVENSDEDFMQAYAYPINVKGTWYVFYNNSFTSSICVARMELDG